MKQCEFCGASMANEADFCGKCGRVPSQVAQRATGISDLSTINMENAPDLDDDTQTTLSLSGKHLVPRSPSGVLRPVTLIPIPDGEEEEDEEEEERRRAALFGMGLPLMGEIAYQPAPGPAPVIQGTPPLAHVPTISGTPTVQGNTLFGPGSPATSGNPPPLPHVHPPQPLFQPPPVRPAQPPTGPTGQPSGGAPGCLPLAAILVAAILLILATSFGLGLTVFAPGLSLSGNSTVTPGGDLALHGHNFLPNSSVTLTLDGGVPLYFARQQTPAQLSTHATSALNSTGLVLYSFLQSAKNNVISARGDGTFNVTVQISPTLAPGHHTIHASEGVSHRSAALPFTIALSSPTATATATATPTATTPVPTPTPSPTPTATPVPPPTLSCATPGNLALGPISEFSSQIASAGVTLCTAGTGTLTWKASWNQNQAPWLKMNQSSGFIQAPNQVQATVSASAANLGAGTYTATITFTGLESGTVQTVNVTLTVKTSCVSAAPQGLRFAGVAGTSDPNGSQNVTITNCGLTSNWSASIDNGSSWLSLSSRSGTLKGGATRTISVTASNLNAGLQAGTYQDSIIFTIGADTATVSVTLVVQPAPPTISATNASCQANSDGVGICTTTLTNDSSTTALSWSASSNTSGVSERPASDTIAAAGTESVTIVVSASACGTAVTVTFTAPGNTATITVNCIPNNPIP